MKKLSSQQLITLIKKGGIVYQPINSLIETDDNENNSVIDLLTSQIKDDNWEVLTRAQAFDKGFKDLAVWAQEKDFIVAVELEKQITDEYYISICLSQKTVVIA